MIKQKLTEVAVDAFTDYVKEKLEKLKTLDLDQDGQKDVDQIMEIVMRCGTKCKDALETTDFSKIANGIEQVAGGLSLIRESIDSKKLSEMGRELSVAGKTLGHLAQLSVQYAKALED